MRFTRFVRHMLVPSWRVDRAFTPEVMAARVGLALGAGRLDTVRELAAVCAADPALADLEAASRFYEIVHRTFCGT